MDTTFGTPLPAVDAGPQLARHALSASTLRWNLFLTGFFVLFMELACIRWLASYVVFLQFFTNIVLIACFVGMSIGCLCASGKTDWLARFPRLAFWTLLLAGLTYWAYNYWAGLAIEVGNQNAPQVVFFGAENRNVDLACFVIPLEVVAGVFFVLTALMFVGLGQVLGRSFDAYPNRVVAYTLNIGGSLAGIAAFSLLSFLQIPPPVWFACCFIGVAFFLKQTGKLDLHQIMVMLLALIVVVGVGTSALQRDADLLWSPYYSIKYHKKSQNIEVNTISHQLMVSNDDPAPIYSLIHLMQRDVGEAPFENVLIIGAGSGNDVAHALAAGVKHVDAVEIDPVIQELGALHHPEQPYQDSRVTVHLTDGRNFLRRTDQKYDLVIFALVDSLMLHSSYSNLRLESFLFTTEAFEDVRNVLNPDGVFVMYNYFRQGWIIERIENMLSAVFQEQPLVFSLPYTESIATDESQGERMTSFMSGDIGAFREAFERHDSFWLNRHTQENIGVNGFEINEALAGDQWNRIAPATVGTPGSVIRASTDNWPFLYLREASLPGFYVRGMIMIAVLGLVLLFALAPGHRVALNGTMFFLGAAFMLLETKAVVHLALVFGSTWLVNSLVFFTIMVMILGSNLFVLKAKRVHLKFHYGALFVCLLANCLIPLNVFLSANTVVRYVAPCVLTMIPIFFAGVIFAETFRQSKQPDRDFGANIAGVVIGGLAEYCSLLVGFRYLLVLAILFYALSALLGKKRLAPPPALATH